VILVDSARGLDEAARALANADPLFVDTEFDSNRDGTTLCLLQVSGGETAYLVDTLRLGALAPLAPIFSDPARTWVLHAGFQDVALLMQRFRLDAPPKLFDTQVAWALVGPEFSVSLAYLKFRLLGIRSDKPHQADDWRRRPLPASQLEYAASDVTELPALHAALVARLAELGRADAVYDASLELGWPTREAPEGLSLSSFRNAWQLDVESQAALRHLVDWFNALSTAERADAPEAKALMSIASRLPTSGADLARIKGVPRRFAQQRGEAFVKELVHAAHTADARDFQPIDPPPYATFEQIRLDGWLALARAEVSAKLSVAPELGFPGRVMAKMRERIVATGERRDGAEALVGWRERVVKGAYLELVASGETPVSGR
jgi:ribonuclease D